MKSETQNNFPSFREKELSFLLLQKIQRAQKDLEGGNLHDGEDFFDKLLLIEQER